MKKEKFNFDENDVRAYFPIENVRKGIFTMANRLYGLTFKEVTNVPVYHPDVAELVRGKTGRVYGDLMSLLTVMKGLPLAYNKDMQEDKEPVFDAVDTVEMCLPVFAAMLDTMTVRTDNMRKAAGHGFINATDCADYLTKKGMPFRS